MRNLILMETEVLCKERPWPVLCLSNRAIQNRTEVQRVTSPGAGSRRLRVSWTSSSALGWPERGASWGSPAAGSCATPGRSLTSSRRAAQPLPERAPAPPGSSLGEQLGSGAKDSSPGLSEESWCLSSPSWKLWLSSCSVLSFGWFL